MTLCAPAPMHSRRDLVLDAVAAALGILLMLVAATGLTRLPYPGDQRYARHVVVTLTAPVSSVLPDIFLEPAEAPPPPDADQPATAPSDPGE